MNRVNFYLCLKLDLNQDPSEILRKFGILLLLFGLLCISLLSL